MEGITDYVTPQKVRVVQIHYTADPDKRSAEWKEKAHEGMTKAMWDKEMEIDFSVYLEKPWYPEFRKQFHVATGPLTPFPGRPILRLWDYGLTPATAFGQVSPKGQLLILYPELQSIDCGIINHGKVVVSESATFFKGYIFNDIGDPAGNQKSQNDEKTANELLRKEYGISVAPGAITLTQRSEAVRKLLTSTTPDGQPMLLVDPRCTIIIGGFTGGYHRKEVAGRMLDEPEKNEYSHLLNCVEYGAADIVRTDKKTPSKTKVKTAYNPYKRGR
jgi:hypothetical protein